MAYDEDLANRVRELIAPHAGLSEQAMFGGLAFLLHGNLAVAVSPRGLLVRVGRDGEEQALAKAHTRTMDMGARRMRGWVFVDPVGLKTKRQLAPWVRHGAGFALTLAPKR
jgi:TfoX/Sxy family transcriptional regulator of competence genes